MHHLMFVFCKVLQWETQLLIPPLIAVVFSLKDRFYCDPRQLYMCSVLNHLENRRSCTRTLFVDCSSSFNSMILNILTTKLDHLQIPQLASVRLPPDAGLCPHPPTVAPVYT